MTSPRSYARARRLGPSSHCWSRWHALALLGPLLGGLPLPFTQPDPEGPAAEPRLDRVEELRARLRDGPGPVRIVVFGDSLAAGWDAATPEQSYAGVFARALRPRHPACEVEVIAAGGPGDSSDIGVIRLDREVISRAPDVVVFQFGGNDQRLGRTPQDLTDDLALLIAAVSGPPLRALCIVATPPMDDAEAGSPFVRAALRAAQGAGVPVADFDRALRETDRDFRGPFCWGGHPDSYGHLVMGKELLRAWDELVDSPRLAVDIEGYSRLLPADDLPSLHVAVRNRGERPVDARLEVGSGLRLAAENYQLQPDEQGDYTTKLDWPWAEAGVPGRTQAIPITAIAHSTEAGASGLDTKWLSVAPVLVPDLPGEEVGPERLTWHRLSAADIVLGQHAWEGDEDLSARFAVAMHSRRMLVHVEVRDNDVSPAARGQHISDGDSVELCLDLRAQGEQGKPVYSPDVVMLLIKPGDGRLRPATWEPLDGVTDRLVGVSVSSQLSPQGYSVLAGIPERVLTRPGEKGYDGIGFDVNVNDADFGQARKCQMVWAGTARNYLNPAYFGALAAPADGPPVRRVSLR